MSFAWVPGLLDFPQEVGLHAAVPVAVKTRKGNLQSCCSVTNLLRVAYFNTIVSFE